LAHASQRQRNIFFFVTGYGCPAGIIEGTHLQDAKAIEACGELKVRSTIRNGVPQEKDGRGGVHFTVYR
jgi:hypothetical protein